MREVQSVPAKTITAWRKNTEKWEKTRPKEVELIDFEEWGARKSEQTPFMPYITNPDGSIMIDTPVIAKHLATLGGKFVIDEKQDERKLRLLQPRAGGRRLAVEGMDNLDSALAHV